MNQTPLGNSGLKVSSIGFGGNALTDFYGPERVRPACERSLKRLGVDVIDL